MYVEPEGINWSDERRRSSSSKTAPNSTALLSKTSFFPSPSKEGTESSNLPQEIVYF